jgi:hypothetical protein
MQNCVQDLFDIVFSSYTCYDIVFTYDTTIISLVINYSDTSAFCMHEMHDTSCDTTIVASLMKGDRGIRRIAMGKLMGPTSCLPSLLHGGGRLARVEGVGLKTRIPRGNRIGFLLYLPLCHHPYVPILRLHAKN